jgi:hypothetical protein
VRITIKMEPDAAQPTQPHRGLGTAPPAAHELTQKAAELGLALEPMHPGTADPQLSTYYTAEAPDRQTAERAVAVLRQVKGVEAAYVKPPDAMP